MVCVGVEPYPYTSKITELGNRVTRELDSVESLYEGATQAKGQVHDSSREARFSNSFEEAKSKIWES